jgi:hypothetical protein
MIFFKILPSTILPSHTISYMGVCVRVGVWVGVCECVCVGGCVCVIDIYLCPVD